MPDQTTIRPVFVQYQQDVDPTPEHPSGFKAGATYEVASPEAAWEHHPDGVILRYADGGEYNHRSAKREVNARNKAAEADGTTQDAPVSASMAPSEAGSDRKVSQAQKADQEASEAK